MGFFDKLFARNEEPQQQQQGRGMYAGGQNPQQGQPQQMTDEQAIARYRYMLQTAPPETIEQAHEEAFGRLTPEQRRTVLDQLRTTLPENEKQTADANQDDPRSLARMATRAEMRQPGTIERTFSNVGPMGGGMSMGGLMAGSFFSSMAGMFVGSMLVNQFLGDSGYNDGFADGSQEGDANSEGGEGTGDTGQDAGGDYSADSGGDYGSSGDFGGGDFGGDFGGGDFGGGDFG
ncbi:MAG: hypothetical protein ABIO92_10030 [Chloroflexia bacterium]